ncbi:hypothetical protein [Litchfieldia alkalitelluris]|uniref:hypothetical protein n=1 Tax=Litchfieldia alkalitelluris TaxID=304268 RepID=UPI000998C1E9|nr:hypothetical protein [Litchfieldia alkalitelluris]
MKKFFIGIILIEMILLITFLTIGSNEKLVTDSPSRTVNEQLRKDNPNQAVLNQLHSLDAETSSPSAQPGLERIKSRYLTQLTKLEEVTSSRMMGILVEAFDEYQQNGMNSQALLSMTNYYSEFKALEKETDAEFTKLYEEMKTELTKHGYSTDEANKYKEIYEQKKKEQMDKFLDKLSESKNTQ